MAAKENIGESTKREGSVSKKDLKNPDFWYDLEKKNFDEVKNYRSPRVEKQWMINYLFYKGYQNVEWDTKWNRLKIDNDDPLHFNVNLVYSVVRSVRNVITRDNPSWDVDAIPYGSMSPAQSVALGQYMSGLYDALGMKLKLKEVVMNGLLYGIGIFQYGWDEESGDGGEVWVESLDPFDTYIGGLATTGMDDAEYVIKVTKRSVDAVKNNPNYENTDRLGADNKESESPWKNTAKSKDKVAQGGSMSQGQSDGGGTVLLHEMWVRVDDEIWVVTTAPNSGVGVPLRIEKTEFKSFPFVIYHPDINPGEIYGEGWVKNIVPLNRAINQLERQILKYNVIFANGKYVIKGGNRVPKVITNDNGQMIRVPQGTQFEQMDVKPMPSTPFNQIQNLMRYLQDIGAAQDALLGRAPTGVTAGVAFETLVASNISNMADLIDNMTETLQELGEAILRVGYENYNTTRTFKATDNEGDEMLLRIVGRNNSGVENEDGVVQLPEKAQVRVTIVSGLAFTKGGKNDLLMQLRAQGDIDRKTLLDELGLDSEQIQLRLSVEQQGIPITDETEEFTAEAIQDSMEQGPGPEPAPEQQMGGGEAPAGPATAEELIAFAQEQGVEVDPLILEDPQILEAVLTGQIPVGIQNGLLTVVQ